MVFGSNRLNRTNSIIPLEVRVGGFGFFRCNQMEETITVRRKQKALFVLSRLRTYSSGQGTALVANAVVRYLFLVQVGDWTRREGARGNSFLSIARVEHTNPICDQKVPLGEFFSLVNL